ETHPGHPRRARIPWVLGGDDLLVPALVKETIMTEPANLDRVRTAALERIEQAEQKYKFGIVFVAAFECVFGVAFLLLMDFRERLHWLILIAACLTYGIVILCVVNLGTYLNSATQTILRAVFARNQDDQGAPSP